jgi:hypothetical protein
LSCFGLTLVMSQPKQLKMMPMTIIGKVASPVNGSARA